MSAQAVRTAAESKQIVKEATEASVRAARDTVVAAVKVLNEAIAKAEETTKAARKAARASVKVFEEALSSAEKTSQEVEEQPLELPSKLFEEAMSRLEPDESKAKPQPREARRDINSRLQFLAKMYATDKDKPFDKADRLEEEE